MIEYHGWITLCCVDKKWSDDNWDAARRKVSEELARFSIENGHSVSFAETANSTQTVVMTGHTDEDISGVLRFMEYVAKVVPDSYGEAVVLEDARPDLSVATRYRLSAGRVSSYDTDRA